MHTIACLTVFACAICHTVVENLPKEPVNANKISLNATKTEMAIFKSKQKKFDGGLKIKLCGKRLYPIESVKYLGVKIDTNLSWQYH